MSILIEFSAKRDMPKGNIFISQTATDVHSLMSSCRASSLRRKCISEESLGSLECTL
jgi:hypothetical protein